MTEKAHRKDPGTLLVILADRLSELSRKGELIERYYNPGDLFRDVHILCTNEDRPEGESLRKTVGSANLTLHNIPSPPFWKTLGWNPLLISGWIDSAVSVIRKIKPDLIRTHNNFLEGYLARKARDVLHIPYIISLHGVWDRDCLLKRSDRMRRAFRKRLERLSLEKADAVIAVYSPIVRYAREYGAKNVHLIYNAIDGGRLRRKENYDLSSPPGLVTINRQVAEKNPEQIVRAIRDLECRYTLIGDGPLNGFLRDLARQEGVESRTEFISSVPNEKLCAAMADYDCLVTHCDYLGISKAVIEAACAGLPIITNTPPQESAADFEGDWLLKCENSPEGYRAAIQAFLGSQQMRREYGSRARAHADRHFNPERMEQLVVELYRSALEKRASSPGG